jgi:hypothetical protein
MSMSLLLASSAQLWCMQSKIFCMPVAVMEPYMPSTPSPPPSFDCRAAGAGEARRDGARGGGGRRG